MSRHRGFDKRAYDTKLTSRQNPRLKAAAALSRHRERASSGLFLLEGAREIAKALARGYQVLDCFYCTELISPKAYAILGELRAGISSIRFHEVGTDAFARIAVREGSDGLVLIAKQKPHGPESLALTSKSLVLAVEAIEKPGNLGALLRTADGAGFDAVIVLGEQFDLYSPHVIRSSLGTVFSLNIATIDVGSLRGLAKEHQLKVFAAALADGAKDFASADFTQGAIILLGSEAEGLSPEALAAADDKIIIPMCGSADSLNVGAAGAVLMYEARRQRRAAK